MIKLLLLFCPIIVAFLVWYSISPPWFCSNFQCCISKESCRKVSSDGISEPTFHSVRKALDDSLTVGWDLGASLFVALDGKPVVDLFGGYIDSERTKPYTQETLSCIFSSGKVLESMAVAIAEDQGLLSLEDPLAKHWPDFAAKGKADITIGDMLSHRSGTSTNFEVTPSVETLTNADTRDAFLASQKFPFPRGTVAYRGWGSAMYIDAIIRRVDLPKRRSLAEFVQQELMDEIGGKIVCPPVTLQEEGLSPVHGAALSTTMLGALTQAFLGPSIVSSVLGKDHRLVMTPKEAELLKHFVVNSKALPSIPDVDQGAASYNNISSFLAYPMMSTNCFSNARSIGQAWDSFLRGQVLRNPQVLQKYVEPLPEAYDQMMRCKVNHTKAGFGCGPNLVLPIPPKWDCVGWGGLGGSILQNCKVQGHIVSLAYVPNGLSPRISNERAMDILEQTLTLVEAMPPQL